MNRTGAGKAALAGERSAFAAFPHISMHLNFRGITKKPGFLNHIRILTLPHYHRRVLSLEPVFFRVVGLQGIYTYAYMYVHVYMYVNIDENLCMCICIHIHILISFQVGPQSSHTQAL